MSIGIPVFNEEATLPAALDSLLAQDYRALQILVCDNASTDATVEVAEAYAARDPRVEVHRGEVNRGAAFNFNRCFHLARGAYFSWASGHDTRLPSAISRCVEVLEADPALALAYPRSVLRRLDGSGEPVENDTLETRGLSPRDRLHKTVRELGVCNIVHGVVRTSALERTRLFRPCFGADTVLLAELALLGEFHQLDEEPLFVRAETRPTERHDERLRRTFAMVGVRRGPARWLPYTVMGVEHLTGVWHASNRGAKLRNAAFCAVWYGSRWRRSLLAEWVPRRARQAAAAVWRRLAKPRARER